MRSHSEAVSAFVDLYYSQAKTAKDVERIFHPGKERPRRLAGGKSRGLDAARMEKTPTDSLL